VIHWLWFVSQILKYSDQYQEQINRTHDVFFFVKKCLLLEQFSIFNQHSSEEISWQSIT
jgi:hypothetical protein